MSRRKQQEARAIQRATGATYRAAGNVRRPGGGGPAGPAGPGGRTPGGPGGTGDDGWPRNPKNVVVGTVIETVRNMPGNSLPAAATPGICAALGIPAGAVGGDIMVTKVAAGPDWFPNIESTMIDQFEDGLELYEVTIGMDVDVELGGLPIAVADQLAAANADAKVAYEDEQWATVAVTGLPLALTAEVRSEFEGAEVGEYWVTVRDE